MAKSLLGKTALVTGASSGIGAATAKALARRGCRVVLGARRLERMQAVEREIAAETPGAQTLVLPLDVTRHSDVEAFVRRTIDHFGSVDLLVNNAGIGRMDWLEKLDAEQDIQDQVAVNLLGATYAARAVLPVMMQQRSGHIINIGSLASLMGSPMYSVYAASKFGLRGFSEALRREVSPWGIRVSIIYPGGVQTDFGRSARSGSKRMGRTPRWLALTPEKVGEAVARLALRPRRSLVLPAWMLPLVWVNALFPALIDPLAAMFLVKRSRAEDLKKISRASGPPQA